MREIEWGRKRDRWRSRGGREIERGEGRREIKSGEGRREIGCGRDTYRRGGADR